MRCIQCGGDYEHKPGRGRKSDFCSKTCYRHYHRPPFAPHITECEQCGREYFKTKRIRKYCSLYCKNLHWRQRNPYKPRPETAEQRRERCMRALESRIQNAIEKLPQEFFEHAETTIRRKLSLPADLISVKSIYLICKDTIPEDTFIKEGAHYIIADMLESMGGVLSEFTLTRTSGSKKMDSRSMAIYRFPPLKERKRE